MSSLSTCMVRTFKFHPITPRTHPITPRTRRLRCSATSESNKKILFRPPPTNISRGDFPSDFKFGAASSAYQIEGGAFDGKGKSIWDTFTYKIPSPIKDGSNGDDANRSYELFMRDIEILKELNVDSYRFSISWSRILPEGIDNSPNEVGIRYYKRLIEGLKENDIKPCMTLFHWDTPKALEDRYNGCLDPRFKDDFRDYARFCFKNFGSDVKQWITFNEPHIFCSYGYELGKHAPGRSVDPAREPYTVAHNLILAHAEAVNLYNSEFKNSQNGEIGITLDCDWTEPYNSASHQDGEAAKRNIDFKLGWFMDPLVNGHYPQTMRDLVGDRLPTFTDVQKKLVTGSFDFIGLNYYQARYGRDIKNPHDMPESYTKDQHTKLSVVNDHCHPIGVVTSSGQYIYPEGIKKLLLHMKNKYNDPVMYITANGVGDADDTMDDFQRIDYIERHLMKVSEAIREEKVNVKGYFLWSLMDSFEWEFGYTHNYGLYAVRRDSDWERIQKLSGRWYSLFLESIAPVPTPTQLPTN